VSPKVSLSAGLDVGVIIGRHVIGLNYLGHYEYGHFRNTPLWKEKVKGYFTAKQDPGEAFMRAVRAKVKNLHLKPGRTYPL